MNLRSRLLPLALIAAAVGLTMPARAADIIDNWATVQAPAAPKLEDVTIDPKTTALLMLDFLKQNCAPNPTCMGTLPAMQGLLNTARQNKMLVIYTKFPSPSPTIPAPTAADVLQPVAPLGKEPMITAFLDKFPEDEPRCGAQEEPHQDRDHRWQRGQWRGAIHRSLCLLPRL